MRLWPSSLRHKTLLNSLAVGVWNTLKNVNMRQRKFALKNCGFSVLIPGLPENEFFHSGTEVNDGKQNSTLVLNSNDNTVWYTINTFGNL